MNYTAKGGLTAALLAATALSAVQAQADISDGVIKIGVMNDQSGPYADNCGAGSVLSVKMAVEDHGGKVNGMPVEVVIADDQNKPDIGVAQALKWVEAEGVDAIVGCSASSIALAVTDVMASHEKPYMIAGTATTETTNSKCTPYNTNWAYNTYTLAKGSVMAQLAQGLDEWYFITVDYTFGKSWQEDATKFIEANGGKVLGSVLHPLGATDFSSQLLQAQASGAKVIGIANAGADLANVLKQAKEFGIAEAGQKLAPLGMQVNNVHGIGLETMQGLIATAPAYWDENDATRAFSEKWSAGMNGRKPNESQTVTYSAVNHYLKAIEAAGSDAGPDVMAKMREMPIDDLFTKASIREDGAIFRDMLQVQVKTPAESKYPWDYYNIIGSVPAKDVWPPLEESACPLVKK